MSTFVTEDHLCPYRERCTTLEAELATARTRIAELEAKVIALEAQLDALKKRLFGRSSERAAPSPKEEAGPNHPPKDPKKAKQRRKENAQARLFLPAREILHPVPQEQRVCPRCGGSRLSPLGEGKVSYEYEYIPGHFERRRHVQEVLRCSCGEGIVVAEGPTRVIEKGDYGPGFLAHLIVAKCADALPLYRQSKQYARLGIVVARSTLCDLYHAVAFCLRPLYQRLLFLIAQEEIVQADETPVSVQDEGKTRRAYVWVFLWERLIVYRYSPTRSGETPLAVLGASEGTLIVDAYTGYNKVCALKRRQRGGCLAHARRYFVEAQSVAPEETKQVLALIREVYRVEHQAKEHGIVRTSAHFQLRQEVSRPTMEWLFAYLHVEEAKHPPQGPMGKAVSYALNNEEELKLFLSDVRIPIDNNASERALRILAVGRKNWLFLGNDEGGEHLAILQTLVASCEASGVNAEEYLADVLVRLAEHPAKRLDELLPQNWKPPSGKKPNPPPAEPKPLPG